MTRKKRVSFFFFFFFLIFLVQISLSLNFLSLVIRMFLPAGVERYPFTWEFYLLLLERKIRARMPAPPPPVFASVVFKCL